ncbi:MarR family winged helix-turn-helix transcriptional regulator [Streptomyces sp. NPDC101237]|uniref:MarR family winged helix-turn-helix transcriptional regulator n=1 Tax=Streptomyces sp. NPDC101237 TaxID=3366139 RepID=UPI0037FFD6C6
MSQPEYGADTAAPADVHMPDAVTAGALDHAIFRVARLHRMLAGQLLRRVGPHPGQEPVTRQLWDRGPQRQTDLVRPLGSDPAAMTRTVRRLENAGFVRRFPCATDKRVTVVEPTAAGTALRAAVERVRLDLEAGATEGTPPERQADALEVLRRIEESLARATSRQT